ncbi:Surfactin synthase thioesterase subunit [Tenacibaculum sp. MAR_2009_124]|uniref:thioesterase II family protein n=1 Tax=Tenacibaculum sp. MAR_2009_124 TaxID=1250059 RepID=UPI0008982E55|nr:thioesterase domain-containing protein [Tenacibaculum sp. MAR_2009_124]SEC84747.1 Surfactin synthase thioesterase subunit [Tenacibaculum sp. MAR_2009_124]
MKIIALPFAGGSKYSFKELEKCIPNSLEWITLELPGRGNRFGEEILEDIDSMVNDLFLQINNLISKEPYMIYGHSLGTLLGYELAKKLVESNSELPKCLYFTGKGAPGTERNEKRSELPKDKFWKRVEEMGGLPKEVLAHQELLDLHYPILKADFKALEEYIFTPMKNLFEIPIFVCMGEDEIGEGEDKVSITSIKGWNNETKFPREIGIIPGKHFFILEYSKQIVSKIVDAFESSVNFEKVDV